MTMFARVIIGCWATIVFGIALLNAQVPMTGAGKGSPGGFSPSSLNPTLWLEASQATLFSDNGTTQITNGGSVQQWNDKSTNARVLNQATGANKPTWTSATNPYVSFDGSASFIVGCFDLALYTSGYSAFAVVRGTSGSASGYVLGAGNTATLNTIWAIIREASGTFDPFMRNDSNTTLLNTGVITTASAFSTTTDKVVGITDDGAGNVVEYTNQSTGGTGSYTRGGSMTGDVTALGALDRPSGGCPGTASAAGFWGGRLYGLVVVAGSVLSTTNRQNLITYLGALAGLSI